MGGPEDGSGPRPEDRPKPRYTYVRDPEEIYRLSFATVRAEADLAAVPRDMEAVAVRLIHACGDPKIIADLAFSANAAQAGRAALAAGAPLLVDTEMVAAGIIRSRLPTQNRVICCLGDDGVAEAARAAGTTRSAAAVDRWAPHLAGAVVAIGNAPTALFRLLELIDAGAPPPALIIGLPVGFIGAAEAKDALIAHPAGVPYIALRGRRGGSAFAAAAVNALGIAPTPSHSWVRA
ncbi:MAG: precorrin-8X methylmutase [Rhodospirillales bacterium]|nr:precorrin-8X methylmutase [Rhodospirillales bacterium]